MYRLYIVFGADENCKRFRNECISDDIIKAIKMYKEDGVSVHDIKRCEQVKMNEYNRIVIYKLMQVNCKI